MNSKRLAVVCIGHALIFAAAILISSLVLAGTGHNQTISNLILALWFISSLFIPGTAERVKCEWSCIRRLFGFSGKPSSKG